MIQILNTSKFSFTFIIIVVSVAMIGLLIPMEVNAKNRAETYCEFKGGEWSYEKIDCIMESEEAYESYRDVLCNTQKNIQLFGMICLKEEIPGRD